jgi:hypothetical protein
MIKNENKKPRIMVGGIKIAITELDIFFKERYDKLDARITRLERRLGGKYE